ncbi:MAG: selenocysteine-specific translation elongation factor [Syntrophales bacterium]|jgi:selenocysteine-specific elongation factor|nr:selenocysteine-specific translation elongation factor [Syntrophales bacterium]
MKNIILGTAGHIDHGKTAFIRALTGIECDRLEEEKRRGITIVLGYAHLYLPSGVKVGIVDVPGHERFVNRMVAGAAGIDIVALLIAADEGIKPQTLEHLYICEILGIKKGIVVLNKKDLADEELLYLQKEEIGDLTAGTFLADAPIIPVSSVTGEGLPEFIAALDKIATDITEKPEDKPFRLPVDAVVAITGFGAVVRGTVLSGRIAAGEEVAVLPAGYKSRIRGLQNHGIGVAEGRAGERLAINMADIKTEEMDRGMVVVRPDTFQATERMLVEFHYLPYNRKPLKTLSHGQFHVLAAKVNARMELLSEEKLLPGEKAAAIVTTVNPVVVTWGDPFVIRGYGMFTTIGGGRILHPALPEDGMENLSEDFIQTLTAGNLREKIILFVRERGDKGLRRSSLSGILNENEDEIGKQVGALKKAAFLYEDDGARLFHRKPVLALRRIIGAIIAEFHQQYDLRTGMGKEELFRKTAAAPGLFQLTLALMIREGQVETTADLVKAKDFNFAGKGAANLLFAQVEDLIRQYGLQPEAPTAGAKKLNLEKKKFMDVLDSLTRSGRLIRVNADQYLHPEHLERARAALKGFFENHAVLTPADARDLLGVSRKYLIPLMEYLDGIKFTARTPEGRKLLVTGCSY